MRKSLRLPDSEICIMRILWTAKRGMLSSEIVAGLPEDKAWKTTTVLTFLSRLATKGFVCTEREGRCFRYFAAVDEREFLVKETRYFMQLIHQDSLESFLEVICDCYPVDREKLDAIEHWLRRQRQSS